MRPVAIAGHAVVVAAGARPTANAVVLGGVAVTRWAGLIQGGSAVDARDQIREARGRAGPLVERTADRAIELIGDAGGDATGCERQRRAEVELAGAARNCAVGVGRALGARVARAPAVVHRRAGRSRAAQLGQDVGVEGVDLGLDRRRVVSSSGMVRRSWLGFSKQPLVGSAPPSNLSMHFWSFARSDRQIRSSPPCPARSGCTCPSC